MTLEFNHRHQLVDEEVGNDSLAIIAQLSAAQRQHNLEMESESDDAPYYCHADKEFYKCLAAVLFAASIVYIFVRFLYEDWRISVFWFVWSIISGVVEACWMLRERRMAERMTTMESRRSEFFSRLISDYPSLTVVPHLPE